MVSIETGSQALLHRWVGHQVASQLLNRELVEGHVGIEGVDHPVTPGPDIGVDVRLVAEGVRVARDVKPVLGPAFPIMGAVQQAIDQSFPGLFLVLPPVLPEFRHLLRGGRQPEEVVGRPPDEDERIGLLRRLEAGLHPTGVDEVVNGIHLLRHGRPGHRSQGPQVFRSVTPVGPFLAQSPTGLEDLSILRHCNGPLGNLIPAPGLLVGPGSPSRDPIPHQGDLDPAQSVILLGRHLHFLILPGDRPVEITLCRTTRHQDPLRILPAPQHSLQAEKVQLPFDLPGVLPVTAEALFLQERKDLEGKEPCALLLCGWRKGKTDHQRTCQDQSMSASSDCTHRSGGGDHHLRHRNPG